jgi:hypothetical protein
VTTLACGLTLTRIHAAAVALRFWVGVFLEGAGVGVEGTGAVKFGDLAEMAEVVGGPLVEHLGQRERAEFGVVAGTGSGGRRHGLQKIEVVAAHRDEAGEDFDGVTLRAGVGACRIRLDIAQELGPVFGKHAADTAAVEIFNFDQMSQDLGDGPALGGRLPVPQVLWQGALGPITPALEGRRHMGLRGRTIAKHRFEEKRRLFQERDGRLGVGRWIGLHGAPPN